MLVLKELSIRLGPVVKKALAQFAQSILEIAAPAEQKQILDFENRMAAYDQYLQGLYLEFVKQVEMEYQQLFLEIHAAFDGNADEFGRFEHSVKLAEHCGVEDHKIIRNQSQLNDLFL